MRGAEAGSKNILVFQYDLSPRTCRPSDVCRIEVWSGPNGNKGYMADAGVNPPCGAGAQWVEIDGFLMAAGSLKSESKAKI
jgi:hypothetical protein